MKKNLIFLVSMLCVSVALFLLRFTGMTAHIIVSVLGLAIMIPITVLTAKDWKCPPAEIIMRAMYLIAVVSGGVLMRVYGVPALGLAHKISAVLFVLLLLVLYIPKLIKK